MTEPVPVLSFFAAGEPVPQGSKKAWLNKATGKVMMREDQGDRHAVWRLQVTGAANTAKYEAGFGDPVTDPSGFGGFYTQPGYQYDLGVAFDAIPHSFGR